MTYAKRLFIAPMSMLAQAAGVASMPFFASLWSQNKRFEFATGVADSASRVACLGLLATSAMAALAVPLVDLLFTGGRFSPADARQCAAYFAVFSVSLFLWSAQAIYSRAFYAAGNTFVPMVAGTIVTVASLPIYAAFYRTYGAMGLAMASDIGIAMQTLLIALLLHKRRMVSLASLDYAEMGRCVLAGIAGGGAVALLAWGFAWMRAHLGAVDWARHTRAADAAILAAGTLVWLLLVKTVLEKTGSALPRVTMKRLGLKPR
jgi:putative peptidoglycan lipid II flippase